ncbi:unnamed protein product [Staurois parvus]|uniref:Uncharacterized protein n=1 Tax=Staurois parvus TaxID=386267 RepID=A0ABN9BAC0_9NEOB|nr:unnamed protein product [Staurois parvus]
MIRHSREHVSTALESSAGVLYTIESTLCIALGDVRLGCSCLAMETNSMKLSNHCCCANLKATHWRSLAIDSADSCRLQQELTLLCHFAWPTTSWPSCSCSQLLPLCYNTTNS